MTDEEEAKREMELCREEAEAVVWMRILKGNVDEADRRFALIAAMANLSEGFVFDFELNKWRRDFRNDGND